MSDEMKDPQTTEQEFLDFVPPVVEPEVEVETEPSALDIYLAEKEKRDAKALQELETKRFQGIRQGDVDIDVQYLNRLSSWTQAQYQAAWKEIKEIPHVDTKRMDAFLELYAKYPEIPLYLKHLEGSSPAAYKKFCETESSSSANARTIFHSQRSMAEMERQRSPQYQQQLKSAEHARAHKDAQKNDADYYLLQEGFKGGYPSPEISLLLTNKGTRGDGLRLCAKAVKLGYMSADSQLARTALDFVRAEQSESSYSADPAANTAAIWNEIHPAGSISAEDRHRIDMLWGGKHPNAAGMELELEKKSPSEHARLRKLAQQCGVVAQDRIMPVYGGESMAPGTSRPGSPAFFEQQKKLNERLAKLKNKQQDKNAAFKF